MAERVSLPVPINIHSRLSQCLFCGLAISLLSVDANYFAQTLFSSKSNMIVHSEQSVTCTQEHVYIILACCAPPSFFVFSLLWLFPSSSSFKLLMMKLVHSDLLSWCYSYFWVVCTFRLLCKVAVMITIGGSRCPTIAQQKSLRVLTDRGSDVGGRMSRGTARYAQKPPLNPERVNVWHINRPMDGRTSIVGYGVVKHATKNP